MSTPDTSGESIFTESLNFKISKRAKARLITQHERLDQTQTAVARLALSLGLEALENLRPEAHGSIAD